MFYHFWTAPVSVQKWPCTFCAVVPPVYFWLCQQATRIRMIQGERNGQFVDITLRPPAFSPREDSSLQPLSGRRIEDPFYFEEHQQMHSSSPPTLNWPAYFWSADPHLKHTFFILLDPRAQNGWSFVESVHCAGKVPTVHLLPNKDDLKEQISVF